MVPATLEALTAALPYVGNYPETPDSSLRAAGAELLAKPE